MTRNAASGLFTKPPRLNRQIALGTVIYGGVHLFSMNFILIAAALVAGAFWGGLYLWRRDLGLVIVSHSLWSAFIFAVFPMH